MVIIESQVIGEKATVKRFSSITVAFSYFKSLLSQWSEISPMVTNVTTDTGVFVMFNDGYITIKYE